MTNAADWRPWVRRLLTDESPYDYDSVQIIRRETQPAADERAEDTVSPIGAPGWWNARGLWWRPVQ